VTCEEPVIWHFIFGACEMIHIFVHKEKKKVNNCTENVRCTVKNVVYYVPEILAPLLSDEELIHFS
jgi:hypothetical protein